MRLDLQPKWRGAVEVAGIAPNGSSLTLSFRTNARRPKAVITIDLYDATEIARKVHQAIATQAQYVERLKRRANGTGY